MKILHIIPSYEPAWELGGVVHSVNLLCRGQARQGVAVTVFTTDSARDYRLEVPVNQRLELGGVEVYYFKTDFSLNFAYSKALKTACQDMIKNFDIINLHSYWNYPSIPAYREAKKHNIPYIIHTHGSSSPYALKTRFFRKWVYKKLVLDWQIRQAAAIRFTTELERTISCYREIEVPSFVVANGINISEFKESGDKQILKKDLGISADTQVILYLGRLHEGKGLDLLLNAFALVVKSFPDTVLIVAGPDFGMMDKLKNLAARVGIQSKVLFPGYIAPEDTKKLYGAADLFALASEGENFSNVTVEAMLSGVPVLVSDQVGICKDVLADGAGMVVPLNIELIAQAINRMLADPAGLKAMGLAAAAKARQRYDNDMVAQKMIVAYIDILEGKRSPEVSWYCYDGT